MVERVLVWFGSITIGGLVEPAYELAIGPGQGAQVRRADILTVQTIETVLFAIGFGLLVYSIRRYRTNDRTYSESYSDSQSD